MGRSHFLPARKQNATTTITDGGATLPELQIIHFTYVALDVDVPVILAHSNLLGAGRMLALPDIHTIPCLSRNYSAAGELNAPNLAKSQCN